MSVILPSFLQIVTKCSETHFKNWIENSEDKITISNYAGVWFCNFMKILLRETND